MCVAKSSSGLGVQLATIDCGGRPGFTVENGNAIIAGVIVNNCQRPGGNGGAFYTRYANIALQGVKVTNSGADKGAAFYLENGSGTIARSYFTSNTATTTGGGIYVTGSQLDLIESNMTGNSPNDIACAGATINLPRPAIETGEVECLSGCNSPLCSA
jgi:predicted outer membrane repeat protein